MLQVLVRFLLLVVYALQLNTSSLNYVDVYLTADNSNLKADNINGYFLRIGGTQDDISLFKNVSGSPTLLLAADTGFTNHSSNTFKIKVTRSAANLFTIFTDVTATGNAYTPIGTVNDNTFRSSSFFGISIKQSTASFFQKHFFDDFYLGNIEQVDAAYTAYYKVADAMRWALKTRTTD